MSECDDFDFKEPFKKGHKGFICLRCGVCCIFHSVYVPGYDEKGFWTGNMEILGLKRQWEKCHFLQVSKIVDDRWRVASCKIYNTPDYPKLCQELPGFSGPCPLGLGIWKNRKKERPDIELPEKVKEILLILKTAD